ncbi:erythromycin esterase family protein [Saccharopolyspora sp. CA-218241]|uniref:erythromycin esterase family protein n=1 Tax=Saccharopolyspora sp. CA-218241 TaxID=3240027 RepID=UPI003D988A65
MPEVRSWLADRAVALDADPAPLRRIWDGVRVFGLGEAVHGAGEFFARKHRLIEFLVTELGIRVVAMEAAGSAARAVDDYVVRGVGDPAEVLAGLGFWTWNTGEVLALLEWLRAHNAARDLPQRVRFTGIDPQLPGSSATARVAVDSVRDFLTATAPESAARHADDLEAVAGSRITGPVLPPSVLRTAEDVAGTVHARSAPEPVREHAAHLVRAARLATADRSGPDSVYAVRDRLMAEAVAEAAGSGPVAVWAHNGHLRSGSAVDGVLPMGAHLRRRFGAEYYALGLVFGSGRFWARRARWSRRTPTRPVEHRRGPAPPVTAEGRLAAAHPGDHLVDLRDDDPPPAAAEWLRSRTWTRQHGAVESPFYRLGYTPTVLAEDYDGLALVERITPSTLLG